LSQGATGEPALPARLWPMPTKAGRRAILAATSAVEVDVGETQRLARAAPAAWRPPAARVLSPSLLLLILVGRAALAVPPARGFLAAHAQDEASRPADGLEHRVKAIRFGFFALTGGLVVVVYAVAPFAVSLHAALGGLLLPAVLGSAAVGACGARIAAVLRRAAPISGPSSDLLAMPVIEPAAGPPPVP
jgi:hypothetical protein